jgi:hypothetical protein
VSLLLGAETVTLYPGAGQDTHGWATAGSSPVWTGAGNLQRSPGRSDPRAEAGGGHGPYDPRTGELATLYLPPDAPLSDGLVAEVGGRHFALSQARLTLDPTGSGALDCWVAVATGTDGWAP